MGLGRQLINAEVKMDRRAKRTGGSYSEQYAPREKYTGTVKYFNDEKGFGFITPDQPIDGESLDEVFVHRTGIMNGDGLVQDEQIEFTVMWEAKKGKFRALNVTAQHGLRTAGRNDYREEQRKKKEGGIPSEPIVPPTPPAEQVLSQPYGPARIDGHATASRSSPYVGTPVIGAYVPGGILPGGIFPR